MLSCPPRLHSYNFLLKIGNTILILDATYSDPLGEAPARPKTAGRQRHQPQEDEFGDEELGDDLLPE